MNESFIQCINAHCNCEIVQFITWIDERHVQQHQQQQWINCKYFKYFEFVEGRDSEWETNWEWFKKKHFSILRFVSFGLCFLYTTRLYAHVLSLPGLQFCSLCSSPMPNWNLLNVIKCYLCAVHSQSFSDVTWNTIFVHYHQTINISGEAEKKKYAS